jgi:hypothetical protein
MIDVERVVGGAKGRLKTVKCDVVRYCVLRCDLTVAEGASVAEWSKAEHLRCSEHLVLAGSNPVGCTFVVHATKTNSFLIMSNTLRQ